MSLASTVILWFIMLLSITYLPHFVKGGVSVEDIYTISRVGEGDSDLPGLKTLRYRF